MLDVAQPPRDLDAPILSENSRKVLEKRYLRRNGDTLLETPGDRFWAIAYELAASSAHYGADRDEVARDYYALMARGEFLPNSPTIMNAGKGNGLNLSACFVVPIEDDLNDIFEAVQRVALIHKSGGGTGMAFSRLRPAGDWVGTTGGVSSGPVSFMEVFNAATEQVKQGATRRGANMGVLVCTHPDILEFINCKRIPRGWTKYVYDRMSGVLGAAELATLKSALLEKQIANFNISVAITDEFMAALETDDTYALIHPTSGEHVGCLRARDVFDAICEAAWETGDPGLLFIDRANNSASNPNPNAYTIETSNPCGEQLLPPSDVCNLGSINLAKFVLPERVQQRSAEEHEGRFRLTVLDCIDRQALERATRLAVRLLDDVVERNPYPDAEIDATAKNSRRLGLGVMGWADLLIALEVPYDSDYAQALGRTLMQDITDWARDESCTLGHQRGSFPLFETSIYADRFRALRNATLTTVAPTGTISIIAGCSSGIEPLFALAFDRAGQLDGTLNAEVNDAFVDVATREGFWSEELLRAIIANRGSVRGLAAVPEYWQQVFATAHDVALENHIRMQAAFQSGIDNAISKTINLPHTACVQDVARAYCLAYELGCKGITVYRDGCKEGVLHAGSATQAGSGAAGRRDNGVLALEGTQGDAGLGARPRDIPAQAARVERNGVSDVGHPDPGVRVPVHSVASAPTAESLPAPARLLRPRVLRGQTHAIETHLGTAYITINEDETRAPYEVFVVQGKAGSDIAPLAEALGKITSTLLRTESPVPPHDRLREVARRLRGVGGASSVGFGTERVKSLADALARVIDHYLAPDGVVEETEHDDWQVAGAVMSGAFCPDCGMMLALEEGCQKCHGCGYAAC